MADRNPRSEPALRYRPRGKVIPASEVQAWQTGHAFLEAASAEAERLRQETAAALDDAKKLGFEAGRQAGAAAAATLLAETARVADRHLAEADRRLVDLSFAIVRKVLGGFDIGELLRKAVRHALDQERQAQPLTLHVAPDAAEALRADLDEAFDADRRRLITVQPDPSVKAGDCRLASPIGFVDLGIDAQLAAVQQGLAARTASGGEQ